MIEHSGILKDSRKSSGHYICDIKDKKTGRWFRTDDDKSPRRIEAQNVSKFGYIVLYKRK